MSEFYPSDPSLAVNGNVQANHIYLLNRSNVNKMVHDIQTTDFIDIPKLFNDPADYIISLRAFPMDLRNLFTSGAENQPIQCGKVTLSTARGVDVEGSNTTIQTIGTITISRWADSFLDYAPYTTIELYLPYIGYVTLDNDLVLDQTVKVDYAIDPRSGKFTAFISTGNATEATRRIIMTREGTLGVEVQLAGGSGSEMARNLLTFGSKTAAGAATAVISGGAALPGAITGLASSAIGAITANREVIKKEGSYQPSTAIYSPNKAYLVITKPRIVRPSSYNNTVGRPSGRTKQLQELEGYTVVSSVHVEGSGFASATSEELSDIERILKSGVIL